MKYSRQIKFFENTCNFNNNKLNLFQKSFENKNIILVGCGGIGSVFAEILVRGGFLNITLIDNDLIDETNISRQVYFEKDISKFKSKTLCSYLGKINSNVKIKVYTDSLDENNISKICKSADLIVDATDNFQTRFIINQFCEENKRDWLYTGAVRSEIICCLFKGKDKLFSKVFPKNETIKDESCCEVGVLASTTFTAASFGFNQVLKYFLNIENLDKETKLIKLNLWTNKIFEVKIK